MPLVATHLLENGNWGSAARQIYCGLDTMVTTEVLEALKGMRNTTPDVYHFERALQGPILEMTLRGFKIDQAARHTAMEELEGKLVYLQKLLDRYAQAVWDRPLNANSPQQLQEFFYTTLKLPEQYASTKGVRRVSTNRECLEKLSQYFYALPFCNIILAMRDISKQLSVLRTEVSPDGRMRTSYNIGGTETWRLSSSASAFGDGTNVQNIAPGLRNIFIADPGKKLCVIDLEQAESREVGFLCGTLFNDWTYLDACEGGDLHTQTCMLIWPDFPWTQDKKANRAIADRQFYRDYSYRDMSKRGGHGSNYYGTPFTMARHLKVPIALMESFQNRYFTAFPAITRWHRWVAQQLQTSQQITTPMGLTRHFFGRPNDDSTLREAIAFSPQSSTAIRTNLSLYRIWKELRGQVEILAQTHDSVTFQYDPRDEATIIPHALSLMEVTLTHGTRKFTIPGEAKIGWNWGNYNDTPGKKPNPDGLKKFNPREPDTRIRKTLLTWDQ